jgi:diadenosine tetraphosphate (Ap4A) HIT family hydrolase
MKACRFCSIADGAETASVVLSTEGVVAFLDVSPVNPGHTLVVPRRHVSAFTQLNAAEVGSLALAVQRVAIALKERLSGCVGVTLSLADGEGAGQEVPHVHFHVIPRYRSDDFGWRRFGQRTDRGSLDSLAAKVRITD